MENFELAKAAFFAGLAHLEREEYAQAESRFRESLGLVPDRSSTLTNLSLALIKQDKLGAAKEFSRMALALDAHSPEALFNLGLIELQDDCYAEAIDWFDQAIAVDANFAEAWLNKGLSCHALDRYDEALAAQQHAVKLNPDYAEAHFNCGRALQELARPDEALATYQRAVEIRPGFMAARYQIFSLHLAALANEGLIEKLGAEIAATNVQRELDVLRTKKTMSDFHVLHDLEQTDYLLGLGHASEGLREANASLHKIYAGFLASKGHSTETKVIHLSDADVADISRNRQSRPRYQIPASLGSCLNPENDWPAIEDAYFSSNPEMIFIDNLLSPQALSKLRKFCLRSTVWQKDYVKQYLGAFPDDGFISPLHVRIAIELRQKMPRIFAPHRLEQVWGFKYTSKMGGGINVHADFARVNLNFWITPDEANLDPASGGLIVYDAPCPPTWGFKEYNQDEKAIYAFLKDRGAHSTRVPYRCNRAVLFNSNLFHETDKIDFKEGYENRRINITYLFGKGLKTH